MVACTNINLVWITKICEVFLNSLGIAKKMSQLQGLNNIQ